jgi:hypothetical protein
MLFSQHHIKPDKLDQLSAAIIDNGGAIDVPPATLDQMIEYVRQSNIRQMTGLVDPHASPSFVKHKESLWGKLILYSITAVVAIPMILLWWSPDWLMRWHSSKEYDHAPSAWHGTYGDEKDAHTAFVVSDRQIKVFSGLQGANDNVAVYQAVDECIVKQSTVTYEPNSFLGWFSADRLLSVYCDNPSALEGSLKALGMRIETNSFAVVSQLRHGSANKELRQDHVVMKVSDWNPIVGKVVKPSVR